MQQPNDPRMLVIALQGLPITIALLLSFEHQPVTEKHLCSMLSKTDKTVAAAIHKLKEFSMITRTTQGWMISTALQLPLILALSDKSRNNSDFCPSSSVVVDSREHKFQAESTTTTIKESEYFRLLIQTCENAGIHKPKSIKIAHLPGMTEYIIKTHVQNVLSEGLDIGAAIFRLENEWPVKPPPLSPDEIRRRKYSPDWLSDDDE